MSSRLVPHLLTLEKKCVCLDVCESLLLTIRWKGRIFYTLFCLVMVHGFNFISSIIIFKPLSTIIFKSLNTAKLSIYKTNYPPLCLLNQNKQAWSSRRKGKLCQSQPRPKHACQLVRCLQPFYETLWTSYW